MAACLQLCLKWTLGVLCYSARPCYDIVTCCCADEMNIVSIIWSLFSCAYLTFIMRCTLYQIWALNNLNVNICHVRKMTTACLTLWLIWIMLNLCGQVLLTTLLRSPNSVPAVVLHGLCLLHWVYLLTLVYIWTNWKGLFTWIELLSCWPSLVPGLTCLQKDLQLLTKPTVTAYPPNESMLLLVSPNIKSYSSVESIENVCWAKHQSQSISKGEYYLLCRAWGLLFRWSSTKLFVLENGLVLLPHQERVKLHFQIQWSCRLSNDDFLSVSTNTF